MAYTQTGFVCLLLLHLSVGAELHSALWHNDGVHGILGKVGIYALGNYCFVADGNDCYRHLVSQLPVHAQVAVVRH